MIKIEKTNVYGWEPTIRGMRNPMNSWDKSDSEFMPNTVQIIDGQTLYHMGENDLTLMKSLSKAGDDHAKFLRAIIVYADITAPLYWWCEFDTYKVGTVRNSCSKMHKLLHKPFEMSDFSFDKLNGYKNAVKQFRPYIDETMLEREAWCYYDGSYDISNYGRVRHKFKNHKRIISGSLHQDGYIFVTLHGKQFPLHRLVALYWHQMEYKDGLVVNHIDGNKQNNFADNLEWVTQSENVQHSHDNHLQPKGCTTYTGKFSSEERNEIKRLWDDGEMSKRQLSEKYNVSHTCICDIINDKYKYAEKVNVFEDVARPLVDTLNELRDSYMSCEDAERKKQIWYAILQLLPESYNQKSTVQLNYQVLKHMYFARKNHKLDEWHELCKWIETLPYFKEIILED